MLRARSIGVGLAPAVVSAVVACSGSDATSRGTAVTHVSQALVVSSFPVGDTVPGPGFSAPARAVVAGAGEYLVGWENPATVVRLSASGELLDKTGIAFPGKTPPAHLSGLDFDGTNFRVAGTFDAGGVTKLARFTSDGHFVETTDDALTTLPGLGLACVSDGTCVSYVPDSDGTTYHLYRIDKNDVVVDTVATAPSMTFPTGSAQTTLIHAGAQICLLNGYFTVPDKLQIWMSCFDPKTGAVPAAKKLVDAKLTDSSGYHFVAAGASDHVVVSWSQNDVTDPSSLVSVSGRFSFDGTALDATPQKGTFGTSASAAWTDGFATASDSGVCGWIHLSLSSKGAAPVDLPFGTDQYCQPLVASDGATIIALAQASIGTIDPLGNADKQLYATLYKTTGEVIKSRFAVLPGVNRMLDPAIAWGGSAYLAVWSDNRNDPTVRHIYGARISPTGTMLDASAFPIAFDSVPDRMPAVASTGSGYLVVNRVHPLGKTSVEATFVSADGKTVGMPVVLDDSAYGWASPRVASNGHDYLVAWIHDDGSQQHVYVARFGADGTFLDTDGAFDIATIAPSSNTWNPTVAPTPDGYFVSWRQAPSPDPKFMRDVYGVWLIDQPDKVVGVSAAASLTDDHPTSGTYANDIGAACSTTTCMVVWNDSFSSLMRRFDIKGKPLGPATAVTTAISKPVVTWDGKAFVVASLTSGGAVAGYFTEDGRPFTPGLGSIASNKPSALAMAADGAAHTLVLTATGDTSRLTGILMNEDPVPPPPPDAGPETADASTTDAATDAVAETTVDAAADGDAAADADASTDAATDETGPDAADAPSDVATDASADAAADSQPASTPDTAAPDAVATSDAPQPAQDSGCSCETAGSHAPPAPYGLFAVVPLLVAVRARRRRATASASPRAR